MSFRHTRLVLLLSVALLSACGSTGSEFAAPSATSLPPATATIPQTETQTSILVTDTPPAPAQDPAIFGAIGVNEIQAFALEPIAGEIFTRVMNGFVADDLILDYQIVRVSIFPGSGGLLAEISFNVRTTDPAWLADGGTPAADDWINDKCSRFDFVTTETEHQLKNRRLCN